MLSWKLKRMSGSAVSERIETEENGGEFLSYADRREGMR